MSDRGTALNPNPVGEGSNPTDTSSITTVTEALENSQSTPRRPYSRGALISRSAVYGQRNAVPVTAGLGLVVGSASSAITSNDVQQQQQHLEGTKQMGESGAEKILSPTKSTTSSSNSPPPLKSCKIGISIGASPPAFLENPKPPQPTQSDTHSLHVRTISELRQQANQCSIDSKNTTSNSLRGVACTVEQLSSFSKINANINTISSSLQIPSRAYSTSPSCSSSEFSNTTPHNLNTMLNEMTVVSATARDGASSSPRLVPISQHASCAGSSPPNATNMLRVQHASQTKISSSSSQHQLKPSIASRSAASSPSTIVSSDPYPAVPVAPMGFALQSSAASMKSTPSGAGTAVGAGVRIGTSSLDDRRQNNDTINNDQDIYDRTAQPATKSKAESRTVPSHPVENKNPAVSPAIFVQKMKILVEYIDKNGWPPAEKAKTKELFTIKTPSTTNTTRQSDGPPSSLKKLVDTPIVDEQVGTHNLPHGPESSSSPFLSRPPSLSMSAATSCIANSDLCKTASFPAISFASGVDGLSGERVPLLGEGSDHVMVLPANADAYAALARSALRWGEQSTKEKGSDERKKEAISSQNHTSTSAQNGSRDVRVVAPPSNSSPNLPASPRETWTVGNRLAIPSATQASSVGFAGMPPLTPGTLWKAPSPGTILNVFGLGSSASGTGHSGSGSSSNYNARTNENCGTLTSHGVVSGTTVGHRCSSNDESGRSVSPTARTAITCSSLIMSSSSSPNPYSASRAFPSTPSLRYSSDSAVKMYAQSHQQNRQRVGTSGSLHQTHQQVHNSIRSLSPSYTSNNNYDRHHLQRPSSFAIFVDNSRQQQIVAASAFSAPASPNLSFAFNSSNGTRAAGSSPHHSSKEGHDRVRSATSAPVVGTASGSTTFVGRLHSLLSRCVASSTVLNGTNTTGNIINGEGANMLSDKSCEQNGINSGAASSSSSSGPPPRAPQLMSPAALLLSPLLLREASGFDDRLRAMKRVVDSYEVIRKEEIHRNSNNNNNYNNTNENSGMEHIGAAPTMVTAGSTHRRRFKRASSSSDADDMGAALPSPQCANSNNNNNNNDGDVGSTNRNWRHNQQPQLQVDVAELRSTEMPLPPALMGGSHNAVSGSSHDALLSPVQVLNGLRRIVRLANIPSTCCNENSGSSSSSNNNNNNNNNNTPLLFWLYFPTAGRRFNLLSLLPPHDSAHEEVAKLTESIINFSVREHLNTAACKADEEKQAQSHTVEEKNNNNNVNKDNKSKNSFGAELGIMRSPTSPSSSSSTSSSFLLLLNGGTKRPRNEETAGAVTIVGGACSPANGHGLLHADKGRARGEEGHPLGAQDEGNNIVANRTECENRAASGPSMLLNPNALKAKEISNVSTTHCFRGGTDKNRYHSPTTASRLSQGNSRRLAIENKNDDDDDDDDDDTTNNKIENPVNNSMDLHVTSHRASDLTTTHPRVPTCTMSAMIRNHIDLIKIFLTLVERFSFVIDACFAYPKIPSASGSHNFPQTCSQPASALDPNSNPSAHRPISASSNGHHDITRALASTITSTTLTSSTRDTATLTTSSHTTNSHAQVTAVPHMIAAANITATTTPLSRQGADDTDCDNDVANGLEDSNSRGGEGSDSNREDSNSGVADDLQDLSRAPTNMTETAGPQTLQNLLLRRSSEETTPETAALVGLVNLNGNFTTAAAVTATFSHEEPLSAPTSPNARLPPLTVEDQSTRGDVFLSSSSHYPQQQQQQQQQQPLLTAANSISSFICVGGGGGGLTTSSVGTNYFSRQEPSFCTATPLVGSRGHAALPTFVVSSLSNSFSVAYGTALALVGENKEQQQSDEQCQQGAQEKHQSGIHDSYYLSDNKTSTAATSRFDKEKQQREHHDEEHLLGMSDKVSKDKQSDREPNASSTSSRARRVPSSSSSSSAAGIFMQQKPPITCTLGGMPSPSLSLGILRDTMDNNENKREKDGHNNDTPQQTLVPQSMTFTTNTTKVPPWHHSAVLNSNGNSLDIQNTCSTTSTSVSPTMASTPTATAKRPNTIAGAAAMMAAAAAAARARASRAATPQHQASAAPPTSTVASTCTSPSLKGVTNSNNYTNNNTGNNNNSQNVMCFSASSRLASSAETPRLHLHIRPPSASSSISCFNHQPYQTFPTTPASLSPKPHSYVNDKNAQQEQQQQRGAPTTPHHSCSSRLVPVVLLSGRPPMTPNTCAHTPFGLAAEREKDMSTIFGGQPFSIATPQHKGNNSDNHTSIVLEPLPTALVTNELGAKNVPTPTPTKMTGPVKLTPSSAASSPTHTVRSVSRNDNLLHENHADGSSNNDNEGVAGVILQEGLSGYKMMPFSSSFSDNFGNPTSSIVSSLERQQGNSGPQVIDASKNASAVFEASTNGTLQQPSPPTPHVTHNNTNTTHNNTNNSYTYVSIESVRLTEKQRQVLGDLRDETNNLLDTILLQYQQEQEEERRQQQQKIDPSNRCVEEKEGKSTKDDPDDGLEGERNCERRGEEVPLPPLSSVKEEALDELEVVDYGIDEEDSNDNTTFPDGDVLTTPPPIVFETMLPSPPFLEKKEEEGKGETDNLDDEDEIQRPKKNEFGVAEGKCASDNQKDSTAVTSGLLVAPLFPANLRGLQRSSNFYQLHKDIEVWYESSSSEPPTYSLSIKTENDSRKERTQLVFDLISNGRNIRVEKTTESIRHYLTLRLQKIDQIQLEQQIRDEVIAASLIRKPNSNINNNNTLTMVATSTNNNSISTVALDTSTFGSPHVPPPPPAACLPFLSEGHGREDSTQFLMRQHSSSLFSFPNVFSGGVNACGSGNNNSLLAEGGGRRPLGTAEESSSENRSATEVFPPPPLAGSASTAGINPSSSSVLGVSEDNVGERRVGSIQTPHLPSRSPSSPLLHGQSRGFLEPEP